LLDTVEIAYFTYLCIFIIFPIKKFFFKIFFAESDYKMFKDIDCEEKVKGINLGVG
jgi:hypothetical protein